MSTPSEPTPDNQCNAPGSEGQRDAFDAALALHRNEVMQYLRKRLGDQDAAADLTQEALSRMMKYRDSGRIDDHRLMLFRIANNLLLEHHRTRQRHRADSHYSLEDTGPLRAPDPPVEVTIDARQAIDTLLKRTITQLPPKCRLAFMLSRFDGMSYPQIAEEMGISVKMVEKHITKALLACRAAVGDRDF
ncbi:RNA polymerase sigma factor [Pseudoxanthomonas putridarboris]|uniref:RNA polymerase sigma factor n=1 Tax=Pseudoxanthomonas putridarboris TaxID=752605 RepID=A0ABU9IWB4_9GAMM